MAFNKFDLPAKTVALTGSTAKSCFGLKASTNVCVLIWETSVSFDGATSSNAPAVCEFMQATFATNAPGTNSSSATPAKRDTGRAETIQATAATAWTTEPTVLTLQRVLDVGQYMGIAVYMHAFQLPFVVIGAQGCVTRVTSPNGVNVSGGNVGEE